MKGLLAVVLLLAAARADAHPLAPALLELTETAPGRYAVLWRTPVARTQAQPIEPQLPAHCRALSEPDVRLESGEALVTRWLANCAPGGIDGQTLSVAGLAGSGINVIVRVVASDGARARALLGADQPAVRVSLAAEPVVARYLRLGGAHLLTGFDHLLFLLGLFVLVPTLRSLVLTVTAFTIGHSATLALAVLGVLRVPQSAAELAIAGTLVLLALELVRDKARENRSDLIFAPWLMAGVFGLVHGVGFAGALREAGLPAADVPLSLLAFNAGIEVGQLALIALLLAGAAIWRRMAAPLRLPPQLAAAVPAYVIGTMGVYWGLERFTELLG